jgi:amidase
VNAPPQDALEQADDVRSGRRTASDLLEQAIARIESIDDRVGAVIHRRFERARREAASPLPSGPFRGVPLLIKDAVCHSAGDPFHCGMGLLRDREWTAPDDSYLAARFKRAGFVLVGRTNVPELATAYTTEPDAYGHTRNPWATDRSAGGSSGGSAAAVAAGMVAVAHGNDMGGSIRVPASECGVVGLKPSRGRTSLGPRFGQYWAMLTHEGVLTRSVRDTAAVLDAIAGPEPGDPCVAPAASRPYLAEVSDDSVGLRVAVRTEIPIERAAPHPACATAVQQVARCLAEIGHRVEPVDMPALDDEGMVAPFGDVFAACVARDLDRWGGVLGVSIGADDVEPRNWMLAERGRAVDARRYLGAVEYLEGYARRVCASWSAGGFDVLLTPTIPQPPPPLGTLPHEPDMAQVADLGQFTCPFNVTGQPAISLPLGTDERGLPVGVQLVAEYGREDLLLRLGAQLERAMPWSARRPAIWAP